MKVDFFLLLFSILSKLSPGPLILRKEKRGALRFISLIMKNNIAICSGATCVYDAQNIMYYCTRFKKNTAEFYVRDISNVNADDIPKLVRIDPCFSCYYTLTTSNC